MEHAQELAEVRENVKERKEENERMVAMIGEQIASLEEFGSAEGGKVELVEVKSVLEDVASLLDLVRTNVMEEFQKAISL